MAFEEDGFCVVRGPDLLWGGDIRRFHPPAGRFDGVIGGPPCQAFSSLVHLVRAVHGDGAVADNLIPEFERCVREARPAWFVMENVPKAPAPDLPEWRPQEALLRDVWVGGETSRLRRFTFGALRYSGRFHVETMALHSTTPERAVLCDTRVRPIKRGGSDRQKSTQYRRSDSHRGPRKQVEEMCGLQGLPATFFGKDSPFSINGQKLMMGNGVPLPMGRAVARAVREAIKAQEVAA
ncbi:MAG: DNA cytosine methyltransferase [Burkholderiales bacterium]|nr:DNA cytosine methyltransferase [Burkholderiales bacterium]